MRDIYELLLDGSLRWMGTKSTDCQHLAFGFIEESTLAPGPFEATGIVQPVNESGWLYPDDFVLAKFRQLPNKTMAVTIQLSFCWMVNRHSNAQLMHPVSNLDTDVE